MRKTFLLFGLHRECRSCGRSFITGLTPLGQVAARQPNLRWDAKQQQSLDRLRTLPLVRKLIMPRVTHRSPKPTSLSTYEELRNLSLAISVREKQVKLRRLEWDTQVIALPHITPMPGDGPLQIRKPMTQDDIPAPRAPTQPPEYHPDMDHKLYDIMMKVYADGLQDAWNRNPYNKLASMSAQKKREARRR